jgi:hypothetical protein
MPQARTSCIPSRARVRRVFLLCLGTFLLMSASAAAYNDRGKNYSISATFRWRQEWMDARHHARTAWQEGQAAYRGKKAIAVCVTYYAAPYYACEGNFVDWFWGSVGRRSGYLTVVDDHCPRCHHRIWGLFRRSKRSVKAADSALGRLAQASASSESKLIQIAGVGSIAPQLDVLFPLPNQDTTQALAEASHWGVEADQARLVARNRKLSMYLLPGKRNECALAVLKSNEGTILGCSPRSVARGNGLRIELRRSG